MIDEDEVDSYWVEELKEKRARKIFKTELKLLEVGKSSVIQM